jgi:hypothetical protein
MWSEGEEYVQKLAQYLSWSISEGFIVYRKPNGEYAGFLAQMAFDPSMTDPTKPVDVSRFTGLVINADLNENILRSWRFLEGKMISYNNPDKDQVARTNCQTYYTQYTTVTGQSCGPNCHEVFYTVHSVPHTYGCGSTTGSDPGYFGSGANNSGDWYGYGSGGGSTPPPRPTPITNKTALALDANSWERTTFNKRLTEISSAVGLGGSSADITLSKATTMANALSLSNSGVVAKIAPAVTIMGKTLAGVGVLTSGYSVALAIGKTEDFNWTGQDGLNLVATVASGIALFGNPVGWTYIGFIGYFDWYSHLRRTT